MLRKLQQLIRDNSKRNDIENRKCFVCEDPHVENHHILKVKHLVRLLLSFPLCTVEDLKIPTIDLCPTHHYKTHILYGDGGSIKGMTRDEAEKISEMVHLAEASKILNEGIFGESFNDLVDSTIQTVDTNIESYFMEVGDYD